jgi:hypothetical protein
MTVDTGAPPLGQRPNEPAPGKDSLAHPQGPNAADGTSSDGKGTCPDCGLPYGEHPEYHAHGREDTPALPGVGLGHRELGGDPAED